MIMGGRRSREAREQAERLRNEPTIRQPRVPPLAALIMNSRTFKRLMERLDTREGGPADRSGPSRPPAPSQPSDRVLPEKGRFEPRMHPLGGIVFRSRFIQRLLGNPFDGPATPSGGAGSTSGQDQMNEPAEDRSQSCNDGPGERRLPLANNTAQPLTDAELRELRKKALISSLLHSASRWGGR